MRPHRSWRQLLSLALLASATSACTRPAPPQSLLLITLDTTRADRLGPYGYDAIETPTLNRLASQGTLYERAYAVAPETLPSHVSIFTGLYPPSHGVRLNMDFRLPDEAVTLAELMSHHGFHTMAVCGSMVLHPRYGLSQGFDTYEAPGMHEVPGTEPVLEWPAEQVTATALAELAKQEPGPFFLWAHYYDPHSPFDPQPPFSTPEGATPESPELYDLEIASMDYWVGKLIDEMGARGDLDNTLIVVTGDHGESLGEHRETYHMLFVYDATIHVPMILVGPGITAGRRIDGVVSSVDLFATTLALFGIESPASSSRVLPGLPVSRKTESSPRVAYSESMTPRLRFGWSDLESIRTKDWLYIRAPRGELYRLDGSDPGQIVNLEFDEQELTGRLAELLVETIRGMPDTGFGDKTGHLASEEEVKALEALGYVAGSPGEVAQEMLRRTDPKDLVEVAEAFQLARFARSQGRLDMALELLEWASIADPENVAVWMFTGHIHVARQDYRAALAAFEQALAVRPTAWQILVEVAAAHEGLGNASIAEETWKRAAETCDVPEEVWRRAARRRLQRRDWNAAEDALRRVLELDPDDARAQQALESLEKRGEAVAVAPE